MNDLVPIEFNNQRIITTKLLAEQYGTDEKVISQNFIRNICRFKEGKHYFKLQGQELKDFKAILQNDESLKFVSVLYLWTDRGAARHAKILDTDEAWDVYEELEETYFRVKVKLDSYMIKDPIKRARAWIKEQEEKNKLEAQNKLMLPKAEFYDAVAGSTEAIAIGDAAKTLNMGIGRNKLFEFLRNRKILMNNNRPYQRYIDCGYFRVIEQKYNLPNGDTNISFKTLVYQKGLDYIRKILIQHGYKSLEKSA